MNLDTSFLKKSAAIVDPNDLTVEDVILPHFEFYDGPAPLPNSTIVPNRILKMTFESMKDKIAKEDPIIAEKFQKVFFSQNSQNLFLDSFWWLFATCFSNSSEDEKKIVLKQNAGSSSSSSSSSAQTRTREDSSKDYLFARMAKNYMQLFVSIDDKTYHNTKDPILNFYPDCLAQSIFRSFVYCFPKSTFLESDNFKKEVLRCVCNWMTGMEPRVLDVSHWRIFSRLKLSNQKDGVQSGAASDEPESPTLVNGNSSSTSSAPANSNLLLYSKKKKKKGEINARALRLWRKLFTTVLYVLRTKDKTNAPENLKELRQIHRDFFELDCESFAKERELKKTSTSTTTTTTTTTAATATSVVSATVSQDENHNPNGNNNNEKQQATKKNNEKQQQQTFRSPTHANNNNNLVPKLNLMSESMLLQQHTAQLSASGADQWYEKKGTLSSSRMSARVTRSDFDLAARSPLIRKYLEMMDAKPTLERSETQKSTLRLNKIKMKNVDRSKFDKEFNILLHQSSVRAELIDSDFVAQNKNAQEVISSIRASLDRSVAELENKKRERLRSIEENIRNAKENEEQRIRPILQAMSDAVEEKGDNPRMIIDKYKEAFSLIDENLERVSGKNRETFLNFSRKYMSRVREIEKEVKHLEFVKESVNYDSKLLEQMYSEALLQFSVAEKFQRAIDELQKN